MTIAYSRKAELIKRGSNYVVQHKHGAFTTNSITRATALFDKLSK